MEDNTALPNFLMAASLIAIQMCQLNAKCVAASTDTRANVSYISLR